jgi:DNA-binding transcriptional ArsR family regulator
MSPQADGVVGGPFTDVWGNGPAIPLLRPGLAAAHVLDAFERLLWWLFVGSAGAKTRAEVLKAIRQEPRNAQQLSEALRLDYSTVRHHLKVMQQNNVVVTEGASYGKLYFLSDMMEAHWANLEGILERMKRRGDS